MSPAAPYPWLAPIAGPLLARLAAGRMPHALLLAGPEGVGKRALADTLASAALCTRPGPDGTACGQCDSCRVHRAGTHPDMVGVGIAEDKTRIAVDQVRALSEAMGLSRSMGAHRVAILWPAEAMNDNAANGLLKTLEEPPERSLLLLVSSEPSRLPATVRSRCQTVSVPLPDARDTRAWLAAEGVAQADMDILMCLARGAPLAARALSQEEAVGQWHALVEDLIALGRGGRGIVALAESWKALDAERLIRWVQIILWESARQEMTGVPSSADGEDLQRLAKALDLSRVFHLQERLAEWRRLARTTVNPQLLLETVFSDLAPTGRP